DVVHEEPVFYNTFGHEPSNGIQGSDLGGVVMSDDEAPEAPADEDLEETGTGDPKDGGVYAYHVLESGYAGDGLEEGHHSVNLTAVWSDRAAVQQSLFRWIESARLQNTIAKIKRDFVKQVQTLQGTYVRSLEPKFRHDPLILDGKAQSDQGVTWICLPYFSLEPYSGLLGAQNTKSFPTPTLLQARYSQTTRERDMEQVVCQRRGDAQHLCFHVSQLWCLILDNSLLLTYGRITNDSLCEGIIARTVKPAPSLSASVSAAEKTLSVRFGADIMWSIPLYQCETWFVCARTPIQQTSPQPTGAMQAAVQLLEDPTPAQHNRRPTTPSASPARGSQTLSLSPGTSQASASPAAGQRRPSRSPRPSMSGTRPRGEFFPAVFCYLDSSVNPSLPSTPPGPFCSGESLRDCFKELDAFLRTKTMTVDRVSYEGLEWRTRSEVHTLLKMELDDIQPRSTTLEFRKQLDIRVMVFNAADTIFHFFFPPVHPKDEPLPTQKLFWGAVHSLVTVPAPLSVPQDSEIRTKASDRRIEKRLYLLEQELSIIDWIMEVQDVVLTGALNAHIGGGREGEAARPGFDGSRAGDAWSLDVQDGGWQFAGRQSTMAGMAEAVLEPSDEPAGFSYLLLHECQQYLRRKQHVIVEARNQVEVMKNVNRNKINHTKDRQERALYAFTIVTVVFLPLSAIASIFGINASDVRDMDAGQWAYWATALPVTAGVVFLGLLFTGELGNVWWSLGRWVKWMSRGKWGGWGEVEGGGDGDGYGGGEGGSEGRASRGGSGWGG
ncbi:hypothetical protein C8A05DRAFT_15710, partial [Staphylotrichum tortipilum]